MDEFNLHKLKKIFSLTAELQLWVGALTTLAAAIFCLVPVFGPLVAHGEAVPFKRASMFGIASIVFLGASVAQVGLATYVRRGRNLNSKRQ